MISAARTKVLFILLIVWFVLILFRLCYLASGKAESYRISGEIVSGRTYPILALRGRILDANGVPLVWSEKHYDLEISGTLDIDDIDELKTLLPERDISESIDVGDVFYSLAVNELTALEKMVRNTPALHIKPRIERRIIDCEEVKELAGKISSDNSSGVSGWEKEFNSQLAGKDGKLSVTCDSGGRWVKNSSRIEILPVPGRDVRVQFVLPEKKQEQGK